MKGACYEVISISLILRIKEHFKLLKKYSKRDRKSNVFWILFVDFKTLGLKFITTKSFHEFHWTFYSGI